MSEFESLRDDIAAVLDSVISWGDTTNRYADAVNEQVAKLWEDNAELRDELHALANRVEALTRAQLGNFCGRRDCRFTEPHSHDPDDGHVIINHAGRIVGGRQT